MKRCIRICMEKNILSISSNQTVALFSESAGIKNFAKEKILDRFVNSFLVVAGKREWQEEKEIRYVKLNQSERRNFGSLTQIVEQDGVTQVEKRAMCKEAMPFLQSLEKAGAQKLPGSYENLVCRYEDEAVVYPFLTGITLNGKVKRWVEEERFDKVEKALREFYETYFQDRRRGVSYQTEEFCRVFGKYPGKDYYECIQPANVYFYLRQYLFGRGWKQDY